MPLRVAPNALRILLALIALVGCFAKAQAETFVEYSAEHRFQLDFHVPDAALKNFLPSGWEANIAAAGAAKDANLRLIFIDRLDIVGADGKPVGSGTNRLVQLAVPVKQTATGVIGQMIIAGLTEDAADAPGPYGVYLPATTHRIERAISDGVGPAIEGEENWVFAAATGEHFEVHVVYERGPATRLSSETKFFSAADPSAYQIVKADQGLDIMRNATIRVRDRVKEFQYKASGGRIGALFDGTERVLSFDSIPWHNRAIYLP